LKEFQRLGINPFVETVRGSFVQQIEPEKDATRMEEVDEPFSWAFEQACGLREVDELVLNDLTKSWRRPRLRRFWRSRRDF
jgi:hypothetical protein